jgi:glycosyltransferase domain-containing protein
VSVVLDETTLHELARVTVIVPTFSRPDSVKRQVEYWGNRGVVLVILDGSPEPMDLNFQSILPKNVKYVHSNLSFSERRAMAAKFIKTEFAILLPDDEFHLESGLLECIRHLDEHPDVIGCAGKVLGFFVEQGEFRTFLAYDDWLPFPTECSSIRQRLNFALPPLKAHKVECSLLRADAWGKIFSASYSDQYSCGFVYERLLNLYAAVLGRTDLINCVLWMRSLENPPTHSGDVPRLNRHNFVAWATSGEFQSEVDHYFEKARSIIASTNELTEEEVDSFAHRFLFGGIQRQMEKEARSQNRLSRRIGKIAIRYGPRIAKRVAKKVLPSSVLRFTGWRGDRLEVAIKKLDEGKIQYSPHNLRRVAQLSLKSSRSL